MSEEPGGGSKAAIAGGFASALSWRPDSDKFRWLSGILLLLFAAYSIGFLGMTAIRATAPPAGTQSGGDFFGLWSCARFIVDHPAPQIYDSARLHAAQVALGMSPQTEYPFPYPPSFLLLLWPLGLLPYLLAYVVSIGVTLVLFVWATVGTRWRSPMILAAVLAPTTTITIVAGQAGFLAAALLVGGFRLAEKRPIIAGILFGLATYKPQLGVLVPVSLISAGLWRVIAVACATVAALVTLTSLVFGPAVWHAWAANIIQYSDQFAAENSQIIHLMPTVLASLLRLGVAPPVAQLAQFGAACVAICVVWWCFRGGPSRLAFAALLVATLLATPHAFVYDMPILATAVIWVIAERHCAGDTFGTGEIVVMMLAMIAPITLVAGTSNFPLAPLTLVLLLGVIVRRCWWVRSKTALAPGLGAIRG